MKPKHQRLIFICFAFLMVALAVTLALVALRDSIVFFYKPSELIVKNTAPTQRVRLGGMVLEGSVKTPTKSPGVSFTVTDYETNVQVTYEGTLPALFKEGKGIVVSGYYLGNNRFKGVEVLAKHDENYRPPGLNIQAKGS